MSKAGAEAGPLGSAGREGRPAGASRPAATQRAPSCSPALAGGIFRFRPFDS